MAYRVLSHAVHAAHNLSEGEYSLSARLMKTKLTVPSNPLSPEQQNATNAIKYIYTRQLLERRSRRGTPLT
jgi:hypothetical protein